MARINALILAASLLMLALVPIAAFANSSKPNYNNCGTKCTTNLQGGSTNTCNNNPGCTDTKTNPAGNNCTCTGPDSHCSC